MSPRRDDPPRPSRDWGDVISPDPPWPSGRDHKQLGAVLERDDVCHQGHGDRAGRTQQGAIRLPRRPRPGGGGELTLHRGARSEIDERRQRLAGRVARRSADQVAGPAVRTPYRAVGLKQEQRRGRMLEHGSQQASLRAERGRQRLARRPVGLPGLDQLGQRLDSGVEFGERGVEQRPRIGAGHRCSLTEPVAPPGQVGEVSVGAIRPGVLRHFSTPLSLRKRRRRGGT